MRESNSDAVASILFLCGAGILLHHTFFANYSMGESIAFNAAWFPTLLLYLMICVSSILGCRAAYRYFDRKYKKNDKERQQDTKLLIFGIGLVLLYVTAFIYFGFWLPTLIFMPTFVFTFGFRPIRMAMFVTVGFCLTVWLIFTEILQLQIPAW